VSGVIAIVPAGSASLDRASAEPAMISLAAATDIAIAPNSRRRLPSITSDILIELIFVSPLFDTTGFILDGWPTSFLHQHEKQTHLMSQG
jgi:hypothetical protein